MCRVLWGVEGAGNPSLPNAKPIPLDDKHPLHSFMTATPRAGSPPSYTIDLFGTANDHPNLRYTQIRLPTPPE